MCELLYFTSLSKFNLWRTCINFMSFKKKKQQSSQPTNQPTYQPTNQPTNLPANQPTNQPKEETTSPTLGSAFALGAPIDLAADFSGDVGAIVRYKFSSPGGGAKNSCRGGRVQHRFSWNNESRRNCKMYQNTKSTGVELCFFDTEKLKGSLWNVGSIFGSW